MKYIIDGCKFASEPTYFDWDKDHNYPNFEIIDKVRIEREADSLDEAYLWMLTNVPSYAFGSSIVSEDKKSFLLNPVKGFYATIGLPDYKDETIVEYEIKCLTKRMQRVARVG